MCVEFFYLESDELEIKLKALVLFLIGHLGTLIMLKLKRGILLLNPYPDW